LDDPDPGSDRPYRLFLNVRVKDLPEGLPAHGNVRQPNIMRKLYAKVEASFKDLTNTHFLYQCRGMVVFPEEATISADNRSVSIEVSDVPEDKGGIVDGRHTETLLIGIDGEGIRNMRPDQCILVQILVNVVKDKRTSVTVALNSTIPVSSLSHLNAQGYFESMKEALHRRSSPLLHRIQFEQNGEGVKAASIAHLIEMLYCLRLDYFQGNLSDAGDRMKHPSGVLTATKQKIHEAFPRDQQEYEKFYAILPEICTLYDVIEANSHKVYKVQRKQNPRAFQEGNYETTWFGTEAKFVLHRNAVLPMISAFRYMLELGPTGSYQWKVPFSQVLRLFLHLAGPWVYRVTKNVPGVVTSGDTNQMLITALLEFAKDRDEWMHMYNELELKFIKEPEILKREFHIAHLDPMVGDGDGVETGETAAPRPKPRLVRTNASV
jgi:hypothetical protein